MKTNFITAPAARSRRLQVVQYVLLVFFFWAALYIFVPTLSVYAQTVVSNLALVGIAVSMNAFGQILFRIPLAVLADRYGIHRQLIMVGALVIALGAYLMGSANSASGLVIGRTLTGIGASTWILMIVFFSSLFPSQEAVRATAILVSINTVGRLIAATSTGFLNEIGGYSLAFYISASLAILALIVYLPNLSGKHTAVTMNLTDIEKVIINPAVIIPSLLGLLNEIAFFTAGQTFFPILAKSFGAGNIHLSLLLDVNLVVVIVANLIMSVVVKKTGPFPVFFFCFTSITAGLLIAVFANTLWMVFAAQFVMGMGSGTVYSALVGYSMEHVEANSRSTAAAIQQSITAIGMFIGPWLGGVIADRLGIQPMLGIIAGLTFICGYFGTFLLYRKLKRSEAISMQTTR